MVGWLGVSSDAIATGSPATLLTTSTAMAPAASAFRIFVEKEQVPRGTSAISPERLPGANAEQAVLRPVAGSVAPAVTTASGAVRSSVIVANSPEAAPKRRQWAVVRGAPAKWPADL